MFIFLAISGGRVSAHMTCEKIEMSEPSRGSQINELQPELVWDGEPGKTYRLQVAVVLPEGRIVDSFDTMVLGGSWKFNRPISTSHAAVKVIVSSNCPLLSVQDLHADRPYFFVDTRLTCVVSPQSLRQISNRLEWKTTSDRLGYILQIFQLSAPNGKFDGSVPVDRIELHQPNWDIPKDLIQKIRDGAKQGSMWIASVQAKCGPTQLSQPSAITLTSPG